MPEMFFYPNSVGFFASTVCIVWFCKFKRTPEIWIYWYVDGYDSMDDVWGLVLIDGSKSSISCYKGVLEKMVFSLYQTVAGFHPSISSLLPVSWGLQFRIPFMSCGYSRRGHTRLDLQRRSATWCHAWNRWARVVLMWVVSPFSKSYRIILGQIGLMGS